MTKGIIIYNSSMLTEKFLEHNKMLINAANALGSSLFAVKNSDIIFSIQGENIELIFSPVDLKEISYIIFWDKDIMLGENLLRYILNNNLNIRIFNNPISIDYSDNKYKTYLKILDYNRDGEYIIKLPKTLIYPMTYKNETVITDEYIDHIESSFNYPIIIKECYGSFGEQVYKADSRDELSAITSMLNGRPFIIQEYIKNSHGRDVRLQVVGDKVVAAMKRSATNEDFRANLTNGGTSEKYEFSKAEERLALNCAKALKLDFAGVDLLFNENNQAGILCEINSNAHFKNITDATGVDVAKEIISYILLKIKS
ncbi:MAG: RimK family alpha-L-glutamate ligase [Lachnospiraceae bacterium]|nr:RimK family alpha-L-glutamate ligase [Lachnospiraceae bacterium]